MSLLNIITPINLAEEEEKFFQSKSYHPVFKYDWNLSSINAWMVKHPKYTVVINGVINQDLDGITIGGEALFETPWDDDVFDKAKQVLGSFRHDVHRPTLDELVRSQETWIKSFGIDYAVKVVDEHGFVARPNHKAKELQISRYAEYHYFSMESSVRHDAVHLIRYLNGEFNQIKRSSNYLPTEEGLASYMQDFGGSEPNNSPFQHAAEYAVTKICRQGSLRDPVDYLVTIGFPAKLAWQRACRHKFGFLDTSKPGDIMKPAMYFYHSQKIQELSTEEKLRLLMGIITLDDLPKYPSYSGRWNREKLRELFKELD